MGRLEYQLKSYSSIFKALENQQIALQQLEAIRQLFKIQSIPFAEIAIKLNSTFEKLRFLEFDLYDDIEDNEEVESSIIISQTSNIRKVILQIYQDNQYLYSLEARRFEEVIAELLYNKGFEVELTKQTRDNGYDILALRNINGFPLKFLVECLST